MYNFWNMSHIVSLLCSRLCIAPHSLRVKAFQWPNRSKISWTTLTCIVSSCAALPFITAVQSYLSFCNPWITQEAENLSFRTLHCYLPNLLQIFAQIGPSQRWLSWVCSKIQTYFSKHTLHITSSLLYFSFYSTYHLLQYCIINLFYVSSSLLSFFKFYRSIIFFLCCPLIYSKYLEDCLAHSRKSSKIFYEWMNEVKP